MKQTPLDDSGSRLVAVLAAALFLLAWLPSLRGPYGYFIDELYYLACAARPDLGYVDHPPLSIWLLSVVRGLLGDSLPALRLVPALMGAATVLLTGALARRLGAGAFGQGLAALAVMFAPIPLIMFGMYSMNGIEMLLWTGMFAVVMVLLDRDEPRLWVAFGLLAGLGLLNKHTTVLMGGAIALGILLTSARRHLRTPWPWAGAALAALLLAPNLWWQYLNGWPSLEFYRNADLYKNVATPPHEALLQQILFYNPGAFPLWLAGLYFFLRAPAGRRYRVIGWACAALLLSMIFSGKSRPDRIAAMYPILFAGGAAWIESFIRRRNVAWLRPVAIVVLVGLGLVFLPLAVPLLSPETTGWYAGATGVVPQIEAGAGKASELPQWLGDRFGWPEFVADVEAAVATLPPEQLRDAVIVTPSYGHAGAIELFGNPDLPPVLSPQNTYFLWSQELLDRLTVSGGIAIGSDRADLARIYREVERVGTHRCTWCMPWRSELPIYRVWGPRVELREVWGEFRHFE